jgi:hypothetical protein
MKKFSRLMTILVCGAVLVGPTTVGAADDELTVRLPSVVSRSSSMVRAVIRVPREADNRMLRVTLDSDTFYRSSDLPLDGNEAPQSHTLAWHSLPAGEYEVTIQLVGVSGVKRIVRRQLHVIGLDVLR